MYGRCELCGRKRKVRRNRKSKRLVCHACYEGKINIGKCSQCGNDKPVAVRTPTGLICVSCYALNRYHSASKHEQCSRCGKTRPVNYRTEKGLPICYTCRQYMHTGICRNCLEEKIIHALGMCRRCYFVHHRTNIPVRV